MKISAIVAALCGAFILSAWPVAAATWTDSFDYPEDTGGGPAWEAKSITWNVKGGRMTFAGGGKGFIVLTELGYGRRVAVEGTMTLTDRASQGWGVAGLSLHYDDGNHWHLALVESPDGGNETHTVELTESYRGRWLANYEGNTKLRRTADVGAAWRWDYGRPYQLSLTVTPEGIEGKVTEMDGTLRRHLAYAFEPDTPAVTAGRPALDSAAFAGYFDDVKAEVNDMVRGPEAGERREFPPYALEGYEGVQGEKTGFFHTQEIDGKWWLIDPNGRGFYAVGTDHINYNAHWCQKLGYAPHNRNVEAKYGSEEKWAETVAERLKAWGFNTLAAGHSKFLRYTHFAHTEWMGAGPSFADVDDIVPRTTWTGFPNVFSPRWQRHCDLTAERICAPNRDDPWLIGYFLDNELQWFGALTNWSNQYGLWTETWRKPAGHSAKTAMVEMARTHTPTIAEFNAAWGSEFASFDDFAASTEPQPVETDAAKAMAQDYVRLVADRYFKTTTEAIRRHDPNHMVIGCRFAGWAPGIWDVAGKYCDVVTFNYYPRIDVDRGLPESLVEEFRSFHERSGRPVWITEWSFPALDSGLPCRHGAGMRVATQEQKARCYRFFQSTVFSLPFFVGSDYFMYVDEPALGISDTFPEDSNYGLVTETDEPWPELTQTAAEVNAQVYAMHAAGRLEHVAEGKAPVAWTRALPPPAGREIAPVFGTGPLELTEAKGRDAFSMKYDGHDLGTFHPLIHQRAPGDLWTPPDAHRRSGVYEDEHFLVVDMVSTRGAGGEAITQFDAEAGRRVPQTDEPAAYRAGWRFWIPKESSGWFGAQSLWVENAGNRAWTLAGLFHYTRPSIGGSPDGDEEGALNVPNFYIPLGAWEDREAGLGQAVIAVGDGVGIRYWKDKDGFHADCRQAVDVELQPGERYEAEGPLAVHFGYRATSDESLLERLEEVRREVMAYLP